MNGDETARTPITMCWHCDRALDAATSVDDDNPQPESGAVSLCMYCGAVAMFGDDLFLVPPTKEQLDELAEHREFVEASMKFSWARQYVMLRDDGLMRDLSDPDR